MAKVDWDQEEQGTSQGFEVLPKGRYLAIIDESERKQTKAKTGEYLEFTFIVKSPKEYAGRKLWARLNIVNPSAEAQRIGREQFNSLADCCGLLHKVKKTEELDGKAVVLIVAVKDGEKGDMNEVVGFQKYEGAQPSAAPKGGAAKKNTPPPAAARKPAGGFDDMDDDIPF